MSIAYILSTLLDLAHYAFVPRQQLLDNPNLMTNRHDFVMSIVPDGHWNRRYSRVERR